MSRFFVPCMMCFFISCSQYFTLKASQEVFNKTSFDSVNIKLVKDGTYTGYYDMLLVNAMVKATVKNGVLSELKLIEHRFNRTYDGSAVIKQILQKQSLDVDGVSGATYSWKSIVKATERALKTGIE